MAVAKCVSERAREQWWEGRLHQSGAGIIPICHLAGTGFPDPRPRSSAVRKCEPPHFVHTTPLLPPLLPSRSVPPTLNGTSLALLFLSSFWARFRTAPLPALQPSFAGFSNAFSIQFLLQSYFRVWLWVFWLHYFPRPSMEGPLGACSESFLLRHHSPYGQHG